jgi:hypothetical protein
MRMKLKRNRRPVAEDRGRGGYYDIDFMLMYSAFEERRGVYYKALNTRSALTCSENMGQLIPHGRSF